MIPRIKSYQVLDDYLLFVEFDDGYKVIYDVKDDIRTLPSFRALSEVYGLFRQVQLDSSRTCIYWNDEIDLASDSIYEFGKPLDQSAPIPYNFNQDAQSSSTTTPSFSPTPIGE